MKRYVMECMGTFFLAFAVSWSSLTGNPIPIGLMLMAMIYIGYHISGSHYNPALSLAVFMRNRLSLQELGMYMIAQFVGALGALALFSFIADSMFLPETEGLLAVPSGMEALLTFAFCLTALSVSMLERYRNHSSHGVIIGLTLLAIAFMNGVCNPAIAAAALLWNMINAQSVVGLMPVAVYVIAPCVGGAMAALMYGFLNESPPLYHQD